MRRKRVSADAPWEEAVGYSRAILAGNQVSVGGTVATDETGSVYGEGDIYSQTVFVIQKIERALKEVGASLEDVVRTRMFVTNIDDWEGAAKAHGEYFGQIRPATSLIEVGRLISPEFLIEMEADAVVD